MRYFNASDPPPMEDSIPFWLLEAPKKLRCKKCGQYGFVWKKTKHGKWFLWSNAANAWHDCDREGG